VKEPIEEKWKAMSAEQKLDALLGLVLTMQRSLDLCIGYVQALSAERIAEEKRRTLDAKFALLQAETAKREQDEVDTERPTLEPESK
jgi:hypothetical protein